MSADAHDLPEHAAALASEVVEQTLRLAGHVRSQLADALAAAGLNESRLTVLRMVAARGVAGCSQVEIAQAMGQAESSVCTLVDRMTRDRLIERLRCTLDRRRSRLHCTETGTLALDAAEQHVAAFARTLHAQLGDESLAALRTLQEQVLFRLERPATQPAASSRKAA